MKKIKVKANVVRPKSVTVLDLPEMPKQEFPKLSKQDLRKLLKGPRKRKYIDPVLQREKQQRGSERRGWWKNNWIGIAGILITLAGIILSFILSA